MLGQCLANQNSVFCSKHNKNAIVHQYSLENSFQIFEGQVLWEISDSRKSSYCVTNTATLKFLAWATIRLLNFSLAIKGFEIQRFLLKMKNDPQ